MSDPKVPPARRPLPKSITTLRTRCQFSGYVDDYTSMVDPPTSTPLISPMETSALGPSSGMRMSAVSKIQAYLFSALRRSRSLVLLAVVP